MKKTLIEELERIHSITYGKEIVLEDNFLDKIINSSSNKNVKKIDDPKKADYVSDDVVEFFETLESIESPIFQQSRGNMTFQKNVETVQIGLKLLGYQLPKFGIDGLYGPETAAAVDKFKSENEVKNEGGEVNINESTLMSPVSIQKITSPFGKKRSYETHPGVDIAVPSGTEIKSPADGKVIDARFKSGGCGGTIQIEHGNGFVSRYCHCKNIKVSIGDSVKQGDVVGLTGGGSGDNGKGNSTGPHLHFELKKNGQLVDPIDYIGSDVGAYDLTKTGVNQKSSITPEMVSIMITKLRERGVTSDDLKKNIDAIDVKDLKDSNFYAKLLELLGAPVSEENMKFMYAWRQAEGKGGRYNPFNTTWKLPNSTVMNKAGVRNYETINDGMAATVKTLKSGRYDCIVNGLKNDIGASNIAKCDSLKVWGTGDLVAKVINGYESGGKPKISSLA